MLSKWVLSAGNLASSMPFKIFDSSLIRHIHFQATGTGFFF